MNNLWKFPKRKEKITWHEFALALIVLALMIVCFTVLSCNTPYKAANYLKNKGKLAEVCASEYPVHDSIIVIDSVHLDTLYIPEQIAMAPDTIVVAGKAIPFFTKCPSPMVITKTILKDSIIIRKDIAKETALQLQVNDLITVNKDLLADKIKLKSYKTKAWITWILLIVGIVLGVIMKLKKIF